MNDHALLIIFIALVISMIIIVVLEFRALWKQNKRIAEDLEDHRNRNGYGAHDLKYKLEILVDHTNMFMALMKFLHISYRPGGKTESRFVDVGLIDKEAELKKQARTSDL